MGDIEGGADLQREVGLGQRRKNGLGSGCSRDPICLVISKVFGGGLFPFFLSSPFPPEESHSIGPFYRSLLLFHAL